MLLQTTRGRRGLLSHRSEVGVAIRVLMAQLQGEYKRMLFMFLLKSRVVMLVVVLVMMPAHCSQDLQVHARVQKEGAIKAKLWQWLTIKQPF